MSPRADAPRVRQAVVVAADLEELVGRLQRQLGLGPPFTDPEVAHFGLRNAVFALGDTFLEIVSPVRPDTSAGRLLARRGGDAGYMVMFQVGDLPAARQRAGARGVREVFAVSFNDIAEVHLHPVDMGGAIVSLTAPVPPESWRWGGPGWRERSRPLSLTGVTLAVEDPCGVAELWSEIIGSPAAQAGVRFRTGPGVGLVEVALESAADRRESAHAGSSDCTQAGSSDSAHAGGSVEIGGVRLAFAGSGVNR